MSINPLLTLSYLDSDNFNPDLHGARRFALENTEENLAIVRELYNGKLKPYLIDFDTLEIGKVKYLGMSGDVQRVSFELKYKDPNGKPHTQTFPFKRYGLREVFLTRLRSEEYWFLLECYEYHPFGILLALEEQTGVKLTMEDVTIDFVENNLVHIESKPNSFGWYGDIHLRLV